MKRVPQRGGMNVVERNERASTERPERESVALRHSAAATLTDSHSLTTD